MNDARIPDPAALLRQAITGEARAVPWPAPDAAALAAAFPELTIHELAGQGGMATVYRATQARLGRQVALKVMRQDLAGQPQFAERFVREAKALAALANPHVLTIHDFGERAGFCYLVTEYVDGANLRELMRMGQLAPGEVLRIVPQICAGLYFAHQHGVVHRDIKPENVLVDRQGLVKLADFGLAKLVGETGPALTQSQSVFGTPHYMAPEQWHGGGAVDHRADIYSLGVVLYELLTGRLPVGTYAPASQQPGVPAGIDQVVQRSLQQEPEQRYQSARDVQRDIEQQRAAPPARAPSEPQPLGAPRSVVGWLVAAAGALLVGKLGIAAFILWQGHLAMTHYLREATAGQYASAAQELRAAVANGTAWTGQLPTPWNVDTFWLLPPLHRVFAVFAFGLGAALVFFVFATVARARSAHGAVPRWQHTLAGFLVWLPVFLLVSTPLMMLAEHYARASDGVVPVLVAALMLAGAGLLVRALHAAGAARGVVAVRPFGAVRQVALVVAALAMAAAAFCTVRIVWSAQSVRSLEPIHLRALAGQSQQQVVLSLGPPIAIEGEGDAMRWTYAGVDGKGHAVAFRDGEVRMTEDLDVQLVPIELPANGPFLGQPARELLRQLGPKVAVERQVDGSSLIRLPDGGTVRLREGLVVGVK